jgi:hypothetical protein
MIRPGAAAVLARWHEVLTGVAVAGLGGWLMLKPGYVLPAAGLGLALVGAGLAVVGLRRMRLRSADAGPGVVQVVEGQVAYFGPADGAGGGGFVALDEVVALGLSADGARWLLTAVDGTRLDIPRGARGAEALLDALVRLPGLDPAALVRATAAGRAPADRRLWRRADAVAPLTWADGRDTSGGH